MSLFLATVIARTPHWVWAVLAGLIVLGAAQLRPRALSRSRLWLPPAVLATLSLAATLQAFGAAWPAMAAWLAGALPALAWPVPAATPRTTADGRVIVPGSAWPLALMLGVFTLRYIVNVALAIEPTLAHAPGFMAAAAGSYGLMSGIFLARARRLAGHPSATPAALALAR